MRSIDVNSKSDFVDPHQIKQIDTMNYDHTKISFF